jgi:hypothetical protein
LAFAAKFCAAKDLFKPPARRGNEVDQKRIFSSKCTFALFAIVCTLTAATAATLQPYRINAKTVDIFFDSAKLPSGARTQWQLSIGTVKRVRVGDLFDLSNPAQSNCKLIFSIDSGAYDSRDTIALHGHTLSNKEAGSGGWEFRPSEVNPDDEVVVTVNDSVPARFSVGVGVTSACYEKFGSGISTATTYINFKQ